MGKAAPWCPATQSALFSFLLSSMCFYVTYNEMRLATRWDAWLKFTVPMSHLEEGQLSSLRARSLFISSHGAWDSLLSWQALGKV